MESELEDKKICPSCHQVNKKESNYCLFCGATIERVESKTADVKPISATSETNKQEITETLTGSKYRHLGGSLSCFTLLAVLFGVGYFGLMNSNPSSGEDTLAVTIVTTILGLFFIFIILMMLCITFLILKNYRGADKPRTFTISDQSIKIKIPDKPIFQIQWSGVVTVQIYKSKYWSDRKRYGKSLVNLVSKTVYIMNFYGKNGFLSTFGFHNKLDFRQRTAYGIISLIEQYAHRLQKEYIWGKNIKKVRRKRMKRYRKI
ncbi:MAG: hypothetical protein ACFFB0_16085 [Promethearchaeota archaeon]